jgi:hypothetical protein
MPVVQKRPALGFLTAYAFLLAPHALGAESRNCTAVEKARADKQLWLNERDQKLSIEKHLPWGLPEPQGSSLEQRVLAHRDYVVGYRRELLVPLWTAHRRDKKWLGKTKVRVNCFCRNPRIAAQFASSPVDYKEPRFRSGAPFPQRRHDPRAVCGHQLVRDVEHVAAVLPVQPRRMADTAVDGAAVGGGTQHAVCHHWYRVRLGR